MSEMNKYQGKLKKVTLIKKYNGWYACCVYDEVRKPIEVKESRTAGIDPGLKTTLVFSDGNEIDFPKWYQEDQKKLAKMQRKSKKSKKVKALHRSIFNRRAE
jgi:transposase